MEGPKPKMLDVQIPANPYQDEGIQTISADKEDGYAAQLVPDIVYASYGERELRLNLLTPHGNGPFPCSCTGRAQPGSPRNGSRRFRSCPTSRPTAAPHFPLAFPTL